jgi:hypothetical protein
MTETALQAYIERGHKAVNGWLEPLAVDLIATLSRQQAKLGISGGIGEIGIHHGRLFILLHLLRQANERSAAYDLFDMQEENVDASGLGDKAIFLDNLRRHGCDVERIVVKSRNSLHMTAAEVRADAGPMRLFSVDGGHTADITASDLALAEASLCPGGIVILDDYFNQAWPGVSEGAARYLGSGTSTLVPVAIGGNKFIFTNRTELAGRYREALCELPDNYVVKDQTAFDRPVIVVQGRDGRLTTRLASTALWRRIRGTPAGRALKAAALRVVKR